MALLVLSAVALAATLELDLLRPALDERHERMLSRTPGDERQAPGNER